MNKIVTTLCNTYVGCQYQRKAGGETSEKLPRSYYAVYV